MKTLEAHGEHLYQSGQYDAFIDLYKNELDNFPDHLPEMIHDLAFVYLANGDKVNALAFLSAGLERGSIFSDYRNGGLLCSSWEMIQSSGNCKKYNQKLKDIAPPECPAAVVGYHS